MKAGIQTADLLNTVSETYALEIQSTGEFGHGLEGVLRSRSRDLVGIVNGIDHFEWNPESDPALPAHYSTRDLSGKLACKSELLKQFGLPQEGDQVPLIGMVSRLADQKGLDLIAEAMEELVKCNLKIVFLGRGQQRYHDLLHYFASRHPRKVGARIDFDNNLAHRIYAGCDMFLMPSRYEPCGLNQLISLRYGTVPIVRATGGLVDTVQDYSRDSETGTGFHFETYSALDLMNAVHRGLALYSDPARWMQMVHRGMTQDWSWEESARKYLNLYERIYYRKHPELAQARP
jgi:starch synthase